MSRPHRAPDGCITHTSGNRFTNIPWYLKSAPVQEFYSNICPTGIHRRLRLERILSFFGRIVGTHVVIERGGSWLRIEQHKNLRYFPFNDVYCEEHKEWHFKGLR